MDETTTKESAQVAQDGTGDFALRWFETFFDTFAAERDELEEMDRRAGDGDFAVNLGSALKRTRTNLDRLENPASLREVFAAASEAFLNTGGTSGPLLGMWLREFSKEAIADDADLVRALATAAREGVATVQRLGGAQPGDKTMIDAMAPAADSLATSADEGADLPAAMAAAARAAGEGAASTTELQARRGRASYIGDSASGVTDPGAAAVALFFAAGQEAAASRAAAS